MNFRRFTRLALLLVVGLASCAPDDSASVRVPTEVIDSAGISIVTGELSAPLDTVDAELQWEHGIDPSHYPFQLVRVGGIRTDGSVIVADGGNREVIMITPDGAAHQVIARTGLGPSEVGFPRQVIMAGAADAWIDDSRNGKLMRFTGDSLAVVLTGTSNPVADRMLIPIGAHPDGRLLMRTGGFNVEFEGPWRYGTLATFDPTRNRVDTVGSFPIAPRFEPPVSPFGTWGAVSVAGGQFATARTDRAEMIWSSADGSVGQIARWRAVPRYPTQGDWADFEEFMAEDLSRVNPGISPELLEALITDQMSRFVFDDSVPMQLFDDIVGAADGSVWLVPASPSRTSARGAREFDVVGYDGNLSATVRFPRDLRLVHVSENGILGVHTDEFDVPSVALYQNPLGG